MLAEYKIGTRIECGGYYGTIKYVGPVVKHIGLWLGIDWDDCERGKHNGTVNGVHYFDTRFPKSGSFVRREKVDIGQNLINSIKSRYGYKEDDQSAKISEQQLLRFQKDINAPFLQLVGFDKVADKQRNFHSLEIINVRFEKVSSIGAPYELKSLCPNIRELDISKNLISSWTDVFDICAQLKHLYWLNVSENILSLPENYEKYSLTNISVLICGNMNISWADVKKISVIFCNLTELRIPFNNISDLSTPRDHNFKKLKYLNLEGNNINNWKEINKLSVIESLEHLSLENTNLESINFEEKSCTTEKFPNLTILNINNNLISQWRDVGELNKLKSLEHLRFIRNPVLESENLATRQQIIIAKLKNLKSLNSTMIQDDERRGAEYDYIKKYAIEWLKIRDTPEKETFLLNHNRYLELIDKYGLPEESELKVLPNIIETTLINLNINFEGNIKQKNCLLPF